MQVRKDTSSLFERFVLASASPRRRELLRKLGVSFVVVPPQVEELVPPDVAPEQVAQELARQKALDVSRRFPTCWVLGADTIVVVNGKILGKPRDREHAHEMLSSISATTNEVITGICLISPRREEKVGFDRSEVKMRHIEPEEIEAYLDSGEWEGKAGAYAIQETADRFVVALKGSFDNVVGLPTELLQDWLKSV